MRLFSCKFSAKPEMSLTLTYIFVLKVEASQRRIPFERNLASYIKTELKVLYVTKLL